MQRSGLGFKHVMVRIRLMVIGHRSGQEPKLGHGVGLRVRVRVVPVLMVPACSDRIVA